MVFLSPPTFVSSGGVNNGVKIVSQLLFAATAKQKYYDVDGSPTAIEGVKQAGEDSPLAGMTKYAFTDRHLVWLQQYWTSEADFHTLTMNYVLTGDKQGMVNDLNAFFNPMKADVD